MNLLGIKTYCVILLLSVFSCESCKRGNIADLNKGDQVENAKKLVEINRILIKKDRQRIIGYIERNNLDLKESGTGLWYSIVEKGKGKPVKPGNLVSLEYTISLLDGHECYNSKEDGVKTFMVGNGGVESGLEEGILLMHEGDIAKFIMPPHLACGLTGDSKKIPARAVIVYDVELLSIQQ